jgi:hypothetical protein
VSIITPAMPAKGSSAIAPTEVGPGDLAEDLAGIGVVARLLAFEEAGEDYRA